MNPPNNLKADGNDTFSSLIKNMAIELYNIAKYKIDDINDIEDIFQETIIKIYKNYDKLQNKEFFKTWSIKILLNECNKCYKNKYKDFLLLRRIMDKEDIKIEDDSITNFENKLYFRELLGALSDTDQNIFIFYYQCDYSIKEISHILHINENTIKSKIKRNKEKLKFFMKGGSSKNEI